MKRYIKKNVIINEETQEEISSTIIEAPKSPQMGGNYYLTRGYLVYEGTLPLSRLDIVDGEVVELPEPEPTNEWIEKDAFINILFPLIPAEAIVGENLKSLLAGIGLLTTSLAPGDFIDIKDFRVANLLLGFGLTVDIIRNLYQQQNSSE